MYIQTSSAMADSQRSVDDAVVRIPVQVPAESSRREKPYGGRQRGPRQHAMPWLGAGNGIVIDQCDHGDAGQRRDHPADGSPKHHDVGAEFVSEVEQDASFDSRAKCDHHRGERERDSGHDHQRESDQALLHQAPRLRQGVSVPEALHPGNHGPGGSPQGQQGCGDQQSDRTLRRAAQVSDRRSGAGREEFGLAHRRFRAGRHRPALSVASTEPTTSNAGKNVRIDEYADAFATAN